MFWGTYLVHGVDVGAGGAGEAGEGGAMDLEYVGSIRTQHTKELTALASRGSELLSCSKDRTARVFQVRLEEGVSAAPQAILQGHRVNVVNGRMDDVSGSRSLATCSMDGTANARAVPWQFGYGDLGSLRCPKRRRIC
uniref:Uncharacterized protein n=1 Tax=Pinguiococcus pyrenoidosus TaxID=172671 RepID=A0A7R9Y964_9STRA|mmetsp:Transcript_10595/g.39930  ORF Transcript_10595/g.39930 Transcript_10595/m.39930 type:complete len:138 (+) Transcript_10595:219-632(+)